jgi:predicted TIM-barrel fold metal-dependent hydrolase
MNSIATAEPMTEEPQVTGLVDCDVHPMLRSLSDVLHRMPRRAARQIQGRVGVAARDPNRILHPSGNYRHDAVTPSGGVPGSDAAFARDTWLDPYHLAAAVLIPVQAGAVIPWADEQITAAFLSAFNDHLLEEWVGLDDRFRLLISVSPHDPEDAAAEIERLAGVEGVAGINFPHANIGMGRRFFHPLYEAAVRHRMPIVVHPTGGEGHQLGAPGRAGGVVRTYPEHHATLFLAGEAMFASLIFGGVFDDFPDLKVVLSEYGWSWLPPLMWRMDDAWERVGPEASRLTRPPSSYVRGHMFFTTQPIDEPARREDLWRLLDLLWADEVLLFSSDYPHWDTDDPRVVLSSRLPPRMRDAISAGNAVRCFGRERLGL